MKIAVLGCGAMGGIVAIGLHRAGYQPLLIDTWRPHVEAIRTTGFLQTGDYGGNDVRWQGVIPAIHTDELDSIKMQFDAVFLSVKGFDTAWATNLIKPFLAPDGMVISVQNGINEPTIAEIVGPERTIGCETYMGGQTWEPGHIHRTLGGRSPGVMDYIIGEYQNKITQRVESLAQIIRDSIGTVGVSASIMDAVWTKFTANCGANLLAAITSWDGRELVLNGCSRYRWGLQAEVIELAQALGYEIETQISVDDLKLAASGLLPDLESAAIEQAKVLDVVTRSSTLHDALRGTPMEVDQLNGYVVKQALEIELPVPYNSALVDVATLVNQHTLRPHPGNLGLFVERLAEQWKLSSWVGYHDSPWQ